MLDAIKKKLGIAPIQEEIMENITPIVAEAIVDNTAELESLQAQVMAGAKEVEALMAQLTAANTALAEVQKAKEELKVAAQKVKMDARKATIEMNIGTAKAEAFLLATEALDDTAFAAVASALAGSVVQEADTALFKEVGVTGKTVAEALPEAKSEEMKILEAKYKQAPAK